MTTYAVIGTGAVGGFYGIHLARSGAQVHFLIRTPTAAGEPLVLQSPAGEIRLQPGSDCQVHHTWEDVPQVDVALVCVKATGNDEVAPRLGSLVGAAGTVLLIQNGIGAEEQYAHALPPGASVLGGLAFLASHRSSPTRFVHVDYGALTIGRYRRAYRAAGVDEAMQAVAADFGRAGVEVALSDDLLAARWQKLVWNVPFNGLSVLLDASTAELMASRSVLDLIEELMTEVMAAARADGRALPDDTADRMLALTRTMRPYRPSMKLDHEHGRPMEVQVMYRAVLDRARRAGVAMPRTEMLAAALEFLAARSRAPRQP